jgi:hypothetical protein
MHYNKGSAESAIHQKDLSDKRHASGMDAMPH